MDLTAVRGFDHMIREELNGQKERWMHGRTMKACMGNVSRKLDSYMP